MKLELGLSQLNLHGIRTRLMSQWGRDLHRYTGTMLSYMFACEYMKCFHVFNDIYFLFIFFIKVQLTNKVVPISAVQQSASVIHTHIRILLLYSFPSWSILGDIIQFPMLYSRTLLFIHSKCNSLHLLTPNSQPIPLPHLSLLATTSLFSMSVNLFLFCRQVYLCHILDFHMEVI